MYVVWMWTTAALFFGLREMMDWCPWNGDVHVFIRRARKTKCLFSFVFSCFWVVVFWKRIWKRKGERKRLCFYCCGACNKLEVVIIRNEKYIVFILFRFFGTGIFGERMTCLIWWKWWGENNTDDYWENKVGGRRRANKV